MQAMHAVRTERHPMSRQVMRRRETKDDRLGIKVEPSLMERAREYAPLHNTDVSKMVRDGLKRVMEGRLKVLGSIPCGVLSPVLETTERTMDIGESLASKEGDFLLVAEGESLAPFILPDDIVQLRPGIEWGNGDLVAIQVYADSTKTGDCESTLKIVRIDPQDRSKLCLEPLNARFEARTVERDRCEIVGVYRGHIRPWRHTHNWK